MGGMALSLLEHLEGGNEMILIDGIQLFFKVKNYGIV